MLAALRRRKTAPAAGATHASINGAVLRRFGWLAVGIALLAGCAAPYVRPMAPEQRTPGLHEDHAVMADGYVLPLSVWRPADAVPVRAVALALHGLNDYRQGYAGVGPSLARRGIVTYAYDQRGFGGTEARGVWHGGPRLEDDLRTMVDLLRAEYPGLPLYALGESLGGAVLLASLLEEPPAVDGMVLIAPAVWSRSNMPLLQRASLWLAAHLFPGKTFTGRGLKITPSDNIEMLRALAQDELIIKATRVDVLYGTALLMDRAYAAAPRLTLPTLILYGRHDQIIPPHSVCGFLRALPQRAARQWRLAYYRNGYHMLTRDRQREPVLADIAAWLTDTAAPLPSGEEVVTVPPPFCGAR